MDEMMPKVSDCIRFWKGCAGAARMRWKPGLFVRIVIAIAFGIIAGCFLPSPVLRIFRTFDVLFSTFLKFVVPFVVCGLVCAAIVEAGKSAGRMLACTFVLVIVSVIASGYLSYGISKIVVPKLFGASSVNAGVQISAALEPYFKIQVPPVFGITTALALAVLFGFAIIKSDSRRLADVALETRNCVAWILRCTVVPLLPWYIMAMMAGIAAGGEIANVLSMFVSVIVLSFAVSLLHLVLMYLVSCAYVGRNPFAMMWRMKEAYAVGFATCSSAASIPVSLSCVKKCGVADDIAEFVVPMCATIHLAGSMVKLVCCAACFLFIGGGTMSIGPFSTFIFVMTITAIAAPGIPGGVITSSLGALASILLLTPEQCSMLMAVYLAMDGVGSACSVGGHGAIALAVEKMTRKEKDKQ